jgi:hypothetical protein
MGQFMDQFIAFISRILSCNRRQYTNLQEQELVEINSPRNQINSIPQNSAFSSFNPDYRLIPNPNT